MKKNLTKKKSTIKKITEDADIESLHKKMIELRQKANNALKDKVVRHTGPLLVFNGMWSCLS